MSGFPAPEQVESAGGEPSAAEPAAHGRQAGEAEQHVPVEQAESGWRRPSARSLLVSPLRHLQDSLPAMLPLLIFGFSQGGHARWLLLAALIMPVGVALTGWYFTGYRIVGDQFQLRRGAISKQRSTVQLERIRTVNTQATALRRLLRVTDLEVGTGADSPLTLRGIDAGDAAELRRTLLDRSSSARAASPQPSASGLEKHMEAGTEGNMDAGPFAGASVPVRPMQVDIARFDPAWLRFAPFTLSGVATAAAAAGLIFNVADEIDLVDRFGDWARDVWQDRPEQPLPLLILESTLAAALTLTVLSLAAYALANWGYRLSRHSDGTLHVSRGLLTSRATTIEESRLRGAVLERPLLLSIPRGARAKALLTGAGEGGGKTQTSHLLAPPAPEDVVRRAVAEVLRDDGPLRVELVGHGVAATRRRWSRALLAALPCAIVVGAAAWNWEWPGWTYGLAVVPLLAASALALLRSRRLGHRVASSYLVASEGVLPYRRSMLRTQAVIGWVVEESWFQRRRGVATLAATVAASGGTVRVLDVPKAEAVAVMRAATPGLLEPYLG